jgi:hypothetical protein
LLSNKLILIKILFLTILFISCSQKKEEKIPAFNYEDNNQVLNVVKKYFDSDVSKVFIGNFDRSNTLSVVACAEKMDSINWGIKFYHIKQENGKIISLFETDILNGSLKESILDKIKLKDNPFEMLYYNSMNFFMGSGGGEIYSYIIDLDNKEIYYTHFVNDIDFPSSLYISDNVKDISLRNFIISSFKKDYPNLKIVDKDIEIE